MGPLLNYRISDSDAMRILVYYPYNYRSVEQQSVIEMLVKKGHELTLLTTCGKGYIHSYLSNLGVAVFATETTPPGIRGYLKNIRRLDRIVRERKIELVIAQQQLPALFAGILRKFRNFKLIYVRHNSDEDYQLNSTKAKLFNAIINWLTPVKVAPSSMVQNFWTKKEGVKASSIYRINYGYNFNQYERPDPVEIVRIRSAYPASLLILSIARLVTAKRHKEMFSVIERLVKEGIDCKLICLGTGSLENELREKIYSSGMKDHIFLLGRKENVFDYIAASDVFFHLSYTEASNSAVKEVGLCGKPVIVCKEVGDFEDYIIHGKNGFLVSKEEPVNDAYIILKEIAEKKINTEEIGKALLKTVKTNFDIANVAEEYKKLLDVV